jgi:polysaccharide deacetylase family protein (PEP-CTERM system associated)
MTEFMLKTPTTTLNALSIDVEDYYQVEGFASRIRFEDWPSYESRVTGNTWRLLELLRFHRVKATFFILGWIGERFPHVVRAIHQEGHEVASHGYRHRLLHTMTRKEFEEDTKRAKAILEELCGEPVLGYRAPCFSIVQENLWCLETLHDLGFRYDSSTFPIHHDRYGISNGSRTPYYHALPNGGRLLEFPLATVSLLGKNLPVAGGGYFRLFPYRFIRWAIRHLNQHEGAPAVIYLHPWEIDPAQPRINGSWLNRFRHYVNLDKTEPKLRQLLKDFQFVPIRTLAEQLAPSVTRNSQPERRPVAPVRAVEGVR